MKEMKYSGRYWLFAVFRNASQPCGGMNDYIGSYATYDAAMNAGSYYDWCQIFDSKEKKTIT